MKHIQLICIWQNFFCQNTKIIPHIIITTLMYLLQNIQKLRNKKIYMLVYCFATSLVSIKMFPHAYLSAKSGKTAAFSMGALMSEREPGEGVNIRWG